MFNFSQVQYCHGADRSLQNRSGTRADWNISLDEVHGLQASHME